MAATRWLAVTAVLAGLGAGAAGAFVAKRQPAAAPLPAAPIAASNTPGFPQMKTGDFQLIDQHENTRTSRSPEGHHQLVFFGYGDCKAVCSLALPNMGEATELLDAMDIAVTPVMITVDPKRDTPDTLRVSMAKHHPRMIGLTGSDDALAEAYKAFRVKKEFLFTHPEEGDVFSHSSFIYLLAPDGTFETLFAPVTNPARIAQVAAGYIRKKVAQPGS